MIPETLEGLKVLSVKKQWANEPPTPSFRELNLILQLLRKVEKLEERVKELEERN